MDLVKLKKRQKESREKEYLLADEQAEDQIFTLISYYDIDLDFELDGLIEETQTGNDKTDEEKQAGIGLKGLIKELGHHIKKGVLEIEETPDGIKIVHNLINPIGEESENSQSLKRVIYGGLTPAVTQKMSKLSDKKYTFTQKCELLVSYISDHGLSFNDYSVLDKKAARNIGILLIIAQ